MAQIESRLALSAAAVAFGVGFWSMGCTEPADAGSAPSASGPTVGVAVVELFTSQGCSSCPPADRVLAQLAERASRDGKPVLVLSYHVDYWNRLGWSDPYSDEAHSQRQSAYARAFRSRSVYTPQMVVNGRREFVGSDAAAAEKAVREALAEPTSAHVELTPSAAAEKGGLTVRYKVKGAPAGSVLTVAWVDAKRSNGVPRGENAGASLEHINVVRAIKTVKLDSAGEGELRLTRPEAVAGSVIGFVQNPSSLSIVGGSAVAVAALP